MAEKTYIRIQVNVLNAERYEGEGLVFVEVPAIDGNTSPDAIATYIKKAVREATEKAVASYTEANGTTTKKRLTPPEF